MLLCNTIVLCKSDGFRPIETFTPAVSLCTYPKLEPGVQLLLFVCVVQKCFSFLDFIQNYLTFDFPVWIVYIGHFGIIMCSMWAKALCEKMYFDFIHCNFDEDLSNWKLYHIFFIYICNMIRQCSIDEACMMCLFYDCIWMTKSDQTSLSLVFLMKNVFSFQWLDILT